MNKDDQSILALADVVVDVTGKSALECTQEILKKVKKYV